jgi:hypothetical protein
MSHLRLAWMAHCASQARITVEPPSAQEAEMCIEEVGQNKAATSRPASRGAYLGGWQAVCVRESERSRGAYLGPWQAVCETERERERRRGAGTLAG